MNDHYVRGSVQRGFANVETWVFDLDNTLYPHHLNLWQQVDVRIRDYIVDFLKITHDEAFRLQKDYYKRYGTIKPRMVVP
jgi:putative hydrolase of the HAD superfamily